jgi:hypothetical protein
MGARYLMRNTMDDIEKLAKAFADELVNELEEDEFNQVNNRNREDLFDKGICHSHDFIDANMVMLSAFKKTFVREYDMHLDSDIELWNSAWQLAKENSFEFPDD